MAFSIFKPPKGQPCPHCGKPLPVHVLIDKCPNCGGDCASADTLLAETTDKTTSDPSEPGSWC